MDLLETLPLGLEEAEQEREYLSEAWLSTPMLEENNDKGAEMGNIQEKVEDITQELESIKQDDAESLRGNGPFLKWMEIDDMELAMYQQSPARQDILKQYTEDCDWENSNQSVTTQALLDEFETVCDFLTPPQSPPPPSQCIASTVQQQQDSASQLLQAHTSVSCTIDLAQELAMLDEIIRDRVEGLVDTDPPVTPKDYGMPPESNNVFGITVNNTPASPAQVHVPVSIVNDQIVEEIIIPDPVPPSVKVEVVSPAQSPVTLQEVPSSSEGFLPSVCYLSPHSVAPSSPGSPIPNTPASSTCEDGEEASEDPEWVPTRCSSIMKSTPRRQRSKPYMKNTKSVSSGYSSSERSEMSPEPLTSRGKRASRIRGQGGVEDRKERKKEQNKNAATRYRQKKKAEAEEVASEEKELENKNTQLRAKAEDLVREVSYLKKLMREMFEAKGMI